MRYRIIIETDCEWVRGDFKNALRQSIYDGSLNKVIPGDIVFVSQEEAATHVITHDGKMVTRD